MSETLFDKARSSRKLGNPFVLYRKPGESVLNLLVQRGSALQTVSDFSERGFVMAPFLQSKQCVLLQPDEIYKGEYIPAGGEIPVSLKEISVEDKETHLALVSRAIEAIESGSLKKVVVSRVLKLSTDIKPMRIFRNLLAAHPGAFCYHWYHPETGHWLGASPELFLSTGNEKLKTYSLAGTRTYTKGEKPNWENKEIEEQQIVTRYIAKTLEELSIEPFVSEVETVRAGSLWHLRSVIEGSLGQNNLKEVITALHPTPAVCGFPKDMAMQFISGNEAYDRSFYTGFLGELNLNNTGSSDLYVNLRCMSWNQGLASVFIGGGITVDSDVLAEWEETVHKSRTILNSVFK